VRALSTFLLLLISALALSGCKREARTFRPPPPAAATLDTVQVSGLNPGGVPSPAPPPPNIYQESAYAVSQGQELYNQYNCVGCHSNGGGGIGPALMDSKWIYGSEPGNIFATIMQGRPNGMPSWRNRIPDYQAWEIVAYVRSLSGLLPQDVAPSSSSASWATPAPASMPHQTPVGMTGGPEPRP
jgi:cytochrome c oxidase cbb3-type subunit 3